MARDEWRVGKWRLKRRAKPELVSRDAERSGIVAYPIPGRAAERELRAFQRFKNWRRRLSHREAMSLQKGLDF